MARKTSSRKKKTSTKKTSTRAKSAAAESPDTAAAEDTAIAAEAIEETSEAVTEAVADETPASGDTEPTAEAVAEESDDATGSDEPAEDAPPKRTRKRGGRRRSKKTAGDTEAATDADTAEVPAETEAKDKPDETDGEAKSDDSGDGDDADSADAAPKRSRRGGRRRRGKGGGDGAKDTDSKPAAAPGKNLPASAVVSVADSPRADREMVVNYVPGDECRIAVLEEGRLEEYFAERFDAVSHVQNIYVGKVTNVEAGIQAAFVDFGLEQNGFLHISDLHPRYFKGADEKTERVGHKTPRRERPPIQECLRRGQEIAVQVIKEGVGTKGPTVTSYLSIPGRFLVMMPDMDKVGVSRKVEDDDSRRKMREILDQLDLPEGFGFILRTAGMDQTKTELKRDLAYLQRLWKDMERRRKTQRKPCLLYTESDLLVRTLRDQLTSDIKRIVVDDAHALERAARFLRIVSPRASVELVQYTGRAPVFHAMGVEEQIRTMTAREVPLPSGGRLVIDETEALVAIDVNSGRTRGIHDAETNAYRTNMEAAEEICRQLRLRDLGGIVVNDLIDMRQAKHRRALETRFKELLKKDRAKSTVASIGPFGTLELTRQRMRGSHESVHFSDCPTCRGRGVVQRADSVVNDAFRDLASLLQHERVARVELVVSPRTAGAILSGRRRQLNRLERVTNRRIDIRVSDALPIDRVTMYAYDDRGSDVDIAKLPKPGVRRQDLALVEFAKADEDEANWAVDVEQESQQALAAEAAATAAADEAAAAKAAEQAEIDLSEMDVDADDPDFEADGEGGKKKRRRRRRRRRKGDGEGDDTGESSGNDDGDDTPTPAREQTSADDEDIVSDEAGAGEGKKKRRRRRRRGRGGSGEGQAEGEASGGDEQGEPKAEAATNPGRSADAPSESDAEHHDGDEKPRKRRRTRRKRKGGEGSDNGGSDKSTPASTSGGGSRASGSNNGAAPAEPPKPKVRTLYGAGRRKLSASERAGIAREE